jgi:hypothetical protein
MLTPRFSLRIIGGAYPAFRVLGILGYLSGASLGLLLARYAKLDPAVIAGLCVAAAAACLGLIWVSKVVTGIENIVYYRHEIAILLTATIALRLAGQPVLPYLDIVLLGVGLTLSIGRWGCFMAGCCYGRPCDCRWGVVYGREHVREGFPAYFAGRRMMPLPLLESAVALVAVAAGISAVIGGAQPGTALVSYTAIYGAARFILEFLRADPERHYFWHFSEAQWTSFVLLAATLILGFSERLPLQTWHVCTAGGVTLLAALITFYNLAKRPSRWRLLSARHIREIACILERLAARSRSSGGPDATPVPVMRTSLGLVISSGVVRQDNRSLRHYTLSSASSSLPMTEKAARLLAKLLVEMRHPDHVYGLASNQNGIFHVVIHSSPGGSRETGDPLLDPTGVRVNG